ncbi:MAG: putative porin [Pseudomonadota bacterium]
MKFIISMLSLLLLFISTSINAGAILEDELLGIEDTFSAIQFYGDAELRADMVRDLPRAEESSFDRAKVRVRSGIIWEVNEAVELGAAIKLNLNTQSNAETRFNLDNELADDVSIDELFARYNLNEDSALLIGQSEFPLNLSPMVWDNDLRPQGISFQHRHAIGEFSSFQLTAGAFLGNHLFSDSSRINATQAAFRFGEGTKFGYQVTASYLEFNNLNDLSSNELRRTNTAGPGGIYAEDFDIIDIQLGTNIRWNNFPIRARFDLLKNIATSDNGYGARIDLIFGNSIRESGIEFGFAAQRIQQDAVVAAFNDDDWWFATNMRGVVGWFAYGFNESLRGKMSVFHERLDPIEDNNNRAIFDLQYFY